MLQFLLIDLSYLVLWKDLLDICFIILSSTKGL